MLHAATALMVRGDAMIIYPGMDQDEQGIRTAPGRAARIAFIADPDGHGLSLTQVS
jgi:hypothetical protein